MVDENKKPKYHRRNCPTCGGVMTRFKDELGGRIVWSCPCGRWEETYASGEKIVYHRGTPRWTS